MNLAILGWAHLYVFWFALLMLLGGVGVVTLTVAYVVKGLGDE